MTELIVYCVIMVIVAFHVRKWNWKVAVPFLAVMTASVEVVGYLLR